MAYRGGFIGRNDNTFDSQNNFPHPGSSYQHFDNNNNNHNNQKNNIFSPNNGVAGLGHRTGRFYKPVADPVSSQLFIPPSSSLSASAASHHPDYDSNNHLYNNHHPGLENPFVLATLIAGLIGITLSIIIILSIWILKSSNRNRKNKKQLGSTKIYEKQSQAPVGDDDIEKGMTNNKISSKSQTTHNNDKLITELKQQQQQQESQKRQQRFNIDKISWLNKKGSGGNILSKKNKNVPNTSNNAANCSNSNSTTMGVGTNNSTATIIKINDEQTQQPRPIIKIVNPYPAEEEIHRIASRNAINGPQPIRILTETFV